MNKLERVREALVNNSKAFKITVHGMPVELSDEGAGRIRGILLNETANQIIRLRVQQEVNEL